MANDNMPSDRALDAFAYLHTEGRTVPTADVLCALMTLPPALSDPVAIAIAEFLPLLAAAENHKELNG